MTWQPELDELRAREAYAQQMGGADKVKRQHDGGRLTVRERIDALLDRLPVSASDGPNLPKELE